MLTLRTSVPSCGAKRSVMSFFSRRLNSASSKAQYDFRNIFLLLGESAHADIFPAIVRQYLFVLF